MNRNFIIAIFLFPAILLNACIKPPIPKPVLKGKILVDATKDGGVWWSPQGGANGFKADAEHQGKKLVEYLQNQGYQVDELPSGGMITWQQLKNYKWVIRAGCYGSYSSQELLAYDSFLNRSSSLMLLSEYLRDNQKDNLCEHLGLKLEGAIQGAITKFQLHDITKGATSINFIMGSSVVPNINNSNITILGWLDINKAPVMGILSHPKSKIFFIGDTNGIEQVPQPVVSNLAKWLFQ